MYSLCSPNRPSRSAVMAWKRSTVKYFGTIKMCACDVWAVWFFKSWCTLTHRSLFNVFQEVFNCAYLSFLSETHFDVNSTIHKMCNLLLLTSLERLCADRLHLRVNDSVTDVLVFAPFDSSWLPVCSIGRHIWKHIRKLSPNSALHAIEIFDHFTLGP